jgi:hypothetical protein
MSESSNGEDISPVGSEKSPSSSLRIIIHILPFPGLLFSLIWFLRVLLFDPIDNFGFLTVSILVLFQALRSFLHYSSRSSRSSHSPNLLSILWIDKHFQLCILSLSILVSDTYCFIFSFICLLYFSIDSVRIIRKQLHFV